MFCILGWRIFYQTMLNCATQHAAPTLAFTSLEIKLLNRITFSTFSQAHPKFRGFPYMRSALTQLARLSGYLARTSDSQLSDTVIWRCLSRLTDIELGYFLGTKNVAN